MKVARKSEESRSHIRIQNSIVLINLDSLNLGAAISLYSDQASDQAYKIHVSVPQQCRLDIRGHSQAFSELILAMRLDHNSPYCGLPPYLRICRSIVFSFTMIDGILSSDNVKHPSIPLQSMSHLERPGTIGNSQEHSPPTTARPSHPSDFTLTSGTRQNSPAGQPIPPSHVTSCPFLTLPLTFLPLAQRQSMRPKKA